MFPFILIALVVGGVILAAKEDQAGAAPAGPPQLPPHGIPTAALPQLPPGTNAPEPQPTLLSVLSGLSPELQSIGNQVAQVVASAQPDPAATQAFANELDQAGLVQLGDLLRQKLGTLKVPGQAGTLAAVASPIGLDVKLLPNASSQTLGHVNFGDVVTIVARLPGGWAEVASLSSPNLGFICDTCPDIPGGPWLIDVPQMPVATPQTATVAPIG